MASSSSMYSALLLLFLMLQQCHSQFSYRVSNNLPRIGRRGEHQQEMSDLIPPGLKNMLAFVRKFDVDANGCLAPDELAEIPIFKIALENEDFTPLEIVADIVEEYKSDVEGDLKNIVAKIVAATYVNQP